MQQHKISRATQRWVESFVVSMNLCPFAKRELDHNRVRFTVTAAKSEGQLLTELQKELELLDADQSIATTLLIHPKVLQNFGEYNQFLNQADRLIKQRALEGIYQIASFHPEYRFDGTEPDDAENYTNRSPHPMLHLLREAQLERAIADYPDADQIPLRNIELMRRLGKTELLKIRQAILGGRGI
ncbi:MAG: DUF1415 domain-containing protein [Proteobacteria bacterium]|nr:DUF1415 domain-containing protein [Pseudomonadota bacterium]